MRVESTQAPGPVLAARVSGGRTQGLQLWVGRMVQAIVLARGSDGRFLVKIEGQEIWAKSSVEVRPGQILSLQVQTLRPELVLRCVGASQTDYQSLWAACLKKGLSFMSWEMLASTLMETQEEMERAGSGMKAGIAKAVFGDLPPWESGHWDLGRLIRASGIFLEAKLRDLVLGKAEKGSILPDLKADLLMAMDSLKDSGLMQGGLGRMLDLLQAAQCLCLLGQEHESPQMVLILPPWWMPPKSWGDMRIGRWVRNKEGIIKRGWSITLRLEMEDMGRILARIYLLGSLLGCQLKVSREDLRVRLQTQMDSLVEGLRGIWPSKVECTLETLEDSREWCEQDLELPEHLLGVVA